MSEHAAEAYGLAWAMFTRSCASYEAAPEQVDQAWLEDEVREFWLDEAQAVLDHQATERMKAGQEALEQEGTAAWWVLTDELFRAALEKAKAGEDIDVIQLELYANADIRPLGGGE